MKEPKTLNLSLPELSFPSETSNGDEMLSGTKRKFAFETVVSSNSFNDTATSHWFDFDSFSFSKCTASTVETSICGYSSSSSWVSSFQPKPAVQRIAARRTSHKLGNQTTPSTARDEITRQEKAPQQQSESSIQVESTTPKSIPKELRDHCGMGSYWVEPTAKRPRSACRFSREELSLLLEEESDFSTISTQQAPKTKARRPRTILKSSRSNNNIRKKIKSKTNPLRTKGIRGRWSWIDETKKTQRQIRQKPATEQPKKVLMPAPVVNSSSIHQNRTLKTIQDHCGHWEGSYWVEPTGRRRRVSPAYYDDDDEEKRKKEKRQVLVRSKSSEAECVTWGRIHSSHAESTTSDPKISSAMQTKNQEKEIVTAIAPRHETTTKTEAPFDCKRTNNFSEKTPSAIASKPKAVTLDLTDKHKIHQHVVFRAVQGPNRPIGQYALDLVSLVCNNINCHKNKKSTTQEDSGNTHPSYSYQQAHRILDTPPLGHTIESEKERLLRLQLRQRFASAASIGMSPVNFSKKLLALWGCRLEQSH